MSGNNSINLQTMEFMKYSLKKYFNIIRVRIIKCNVVLIIKRSVSIEYEVQIKLTHPQVAQKVRKELYGTRITPHTADSIQG